MNILLVPSELINPIDRLSVITRTRCRAALIVWRLNMHHRILCSGGIFSGTDRQTRSAAELMKEWFVQRGVEERLILTETESVDTYENIAFSIHILNNRCDNWSVTVVTQPQHALRFRITFWRAYNVHILLALVDQSTMTWKDWWLEWLVLVPYHIIDKRGTLWLAKYNRSKRRKAIER